MQGTDFTTPGPLRVAAEDEKLALAGTGPVTGHPHQDLGVER
jgi:hypothetical protein